MKVGDLVKVLYLTTNEYGVIIGTYSKDHGFGEIRYWNVYFASHELQVIFRTDELEVLDVKKKTRMGS